MERRLVRRYHLGGVVSAVHESDIAEWHDAETSGGRTLDFDSGVRAFESLQAASFEQDVEQ
jgi:hypothetical protein